MTHSQEIQNLINTALHAPATGSIIIQGALFLDIISRLENVEQQNAELLAAMIRTERKLSAYVGVCTGDKELLLTVLPMARIAIAKAGDNT